MKMKKYRIVGELADNGQSITKFKKEIKKQERRNSYGNTLVLNKGTSKE